MATSNSTQQEQKDRREKRIGDRWIGVDLDGTLAEWDGWKGHEHIGPPIPAMLERVKRWIKTVSYTHLTLPTKA